LYWDFGAGCLCTILPVSLNETMMVMVILLLLLLLLPATTTIFIYRCGGGGGGGIGMVPAFTSEGRGTECLSVFKRTARNAFLFLPFGEVSHMPKMVGGFDRLVMGILPPSSRSSSSHGGACRRRRCRRCGTSAVKG